MIAQQEKSQFGGTHRYILKLYFSVFSVGGTVASWLVRSTPEQAVRAVFLGKTLYSHGASLHPGV